MELNKHHKESLLSEIIKAKEDLELQKKCLAREESKERNNLSEEKDDLSEWFQISCFLAQERINLIMQSLINNEIDY